MHMPKIIPNKKKALFLAKRQLPELVYDAVNLEGIHYTLPEIQTLLDGVTVGGHRLSDEKITLNQAAAWQELFQRIAEDTFVLRKEMACQLHAIAGKEEALEWGCFREGNVVIAGTDYLPPDPTALDKLWDRMLVEIEKITDPYDRAITVFLHMARMQFFYDVNKRMGRFMMNGMLLSQGYPVINLPAKRQLEFNTHMLAFYPTGDTAQMIAFMKDCLDTRILQIMSE
jgi:Fic family protein